MFLIKIFRWHLNMLQIIQFIALIMYLLLNFKNTNLARRLLTIKDF